MIVNLGGSEISPICQFPINADTRIEGSTVPAGYAAEDVELLLWDTEGKPVASGRCRRNRGAEPLSFPRLLGPSRTDGGGISA